jgi:hypothetical protein
VTAPQASSTPQVRFGQPSGSSDAAPGFGRGGAIVGIVLAAFLLGGLAWSAAAGHSSTAERPRLFGGSLVLEDDKPLPVIDLATGELSERLDGVYAQVHAKKYLDVQAIPVSEGTILVNRQTGTFNLLGRDDYVLDTMGAGVGLGAAPAGLKGASGLADGSSAFIIRYASASTVSLVDQATVEAGAKLAAAVTSAGSTPGTNPAPHASPNGSASPPGSPGKGRSVTPRGFAALSGEIADQPGSAAVAGGDLWTLVQLPSVSTCQVQQLHPVSSGHHGLLVTIRATIPTRCARASLESAGGVVAVAWAGQARLFAPGAPGVGTAIAVPATARFDRFLPVNGTTGRLWFLGRGPTTWSDFGVASTGTSTGRVSAPATLSHFDRSAQPAIPSESGGWLYTLDRVGGGQPLLWAIQPGTGAMFPVPGASRYPVERGEMTDNFADAQVLVDGPRVIFNNPGNILAVVVFTDGSRLPLVINKSQGLVLSPTGPEDLNIKPSPSKGAGNSTSASPQLPGVEAVSQSVTCANTTQKPYAPQITSVDPSATSALVAWSYQLLDEQDCEPDTWTVTVTAQTSSHQPAQPVQIVNGQTQLLFTGLRPATTYRAVVTAYINAQSTPSTAVSFTTAARGPDAPVDVHTGADGKGDWVVSWTPCSPASCLVGADSWSVIGTSCGNGFVGQPPTIEVPAAQTSVTIDAASLGLLGDSLSFSVQGVLASGLAGNPASDRSCTEAWRPPDRSALVLDASDVQVGQTLTATMQVLTRGTSPAEAFGSETTDFVYHIGSVNLPPTTATHVQVPGLAAGVTYAPTVTVYPAGHPGAAVTVAAGPFRPSLAWPPNLGLVAAGVTDLSNPNAGTITLSFPGLPPGPMQVSGNPVQCGNDQAATPISGTLAADGTFTISGFDLVNLGGQCSVSVNLTAVAAPGHPDPYGIPSPTLSSQFTIGSSPTYSFSDQIDPACEQAPCTPEQIEVNYTASQMPAPTAGGGWIVTTATQGATGADPCAYQYPQSGTPAFPLVISLPSGCVPPLANPNLVDVQLSYQYLGTTHTVDAGLPTGTPATTTTTTTTTTTLPPCSSTTTSTTGSSSTDASTTSTTACSAASVGSSAAPADRASATNLTPTPLAATQASAGSPHLAVLRSRLSAPARPGDRAVSDTLGGALVATVVASFGGRIAWGRRRRARRAGSTRGAHGSGDRAS